MTERSTLGRAALSAAMAALMAAVLAGCEKHEPPPAAASASLVSLTPAQRQRVRLVTVQSSSFHDSIEANGAVDFDNDQATTVLAPFSGPVVRLLASVGDRVAKGQPLAMVQSSDVGTAAGAYRKAAAAAANARKLADLDKDLLAHQGIAAREAAQAEADAVGAESDLAAARQALMALSVPDAELRAIETGQAVSRIEGVIRAPVAGVVVDRPITPGQLLQAGTTQCFTVANLTRVWVNAQLFGQDVNRVRVGDAAQVTADGMTYVGKVETVGAQVDPATGAVAARVGLQNPGGVLKKQMFVRVAIQGRNVRTGLLVPASAILRDDENLPFVYLASGADGFARRRVTIGPRIGEAYDITEGLQGGERVVVDGAIFLQFMQSQ